MQLNLFNYYQAGTLVAVGRSKIFFFPFFAEKGHEWKGYNKEKGKKVGWSLRKSGDKYYEAFELERTHQAYTLLLSNVYQLCLSGDSGSFALALQHA